MGQKNDKRTVSSASSPSSHTSPPQDSLPPSMSPSFVASDSAVNGVANSVANSAVGTNDAVADPGPLSHHSPAHRAEEFLLRLKINHPIMELEISTRDARTLDKIKEILELLPVTADDMIAPEDDALHEVALKLSDNFTANKDVAALLRELLRRQQAYRIVSAEIPTTTAIDMETGARSVRVRRADVQRHVRALVASIAPAVAPASVRSGIVHVCGEIDDGDKRFIVDYIDHHFKTADLRAFQSPRDKNQTGILVECIFFGEFPQEET